MQRVNDLADFTDWMKQAIANMLKKPRLADINGLSEISSIRPCSAGRTRQPTLGAPLCPVLRSLRDPPS